VRTAKEQGKKKHYHLTLTKKTLKMSLSFPAAEIFRESVWARSLIFFSFVTCAAFVSECVKAIEESWPASSSAATRVGDLCAELRAKLALVRHDTVDRDDAVHLKDKAARLWYAQESECFCFFDSFFFFFFGAKSQEYVYDRNRVEFFVPVSPYKY
jgi:hypothetical protein